MNELDPQLREILDPEPEAVRRIVHRALREERPSSAQRTQRALRRSGWMWAALPSAAASLLLFVWLWLPVTGPSAQPTSGVDFGNDPSENAPREAGPARLTISNSGGVLSVQSPGGATYLILEGDRS